MIAALQQPAFETKLQYIVIMIFLALLFLQCITASDGHCCISWTKNNYVTDKYRNTLSISNSTNSCTLRECMAVCTGDPDCMSVGYYEGNCLCYVYNKLSTSKSVSYVDIPGWQHFDIQQGG